MLLININIRKVEAMLDYICMPDKYRYFIV